MEYSVFCWATLVSVLLFYSPDFVGGGQDCLSCRNTRNITDCLNFMTCSHDEVCYHHQYRLQSGIIEYDLGCGYPSLCGDKFGSIFGKRMNNYFERHFVCSKCCNNTRLCNQDINCNSANRDKESKLPRECQEIENVTSGVHQIYPTGSFPAVSVFCHVDNHYSWTVIHKRTTGCTDFYRNWDAYKHGFGDTDGEYWLGNENIHELTSHGRHGLYVELSDFRDTTKHAHYTVFSLGDEKSGYQLLVMNYSGNAGDSLDYHNGMKFTTFDKDQDLWPNGNLAIDRRGAWWYNVGYHSNLNGQYLAGKYKTSEHGWKGMVWGAWHGTDYSLNTAIMMIRSH